MDNAIYITTKAVINNLISELLGSKGDVNDFFEFTRHKCSYVYISPRIYTDLVEKLLPKDEDAYKQIDSLINDGGLIIGNAKFESEYEDIVIIANKLRITQPNNRIIIIISKTETLNSKTEKNQDILVFDVDNIIQIIKATDKEFRNLYWAI